MSFSFPNILLLFSLYFQVICCLYIPESGADWTLLKPECNYLPGSIQSSPYEFGIIVSPFEINSEGELDEPPVTSVTRSATFTTTIVTATPIPLPTKPMEVYQLQDGQVQRHPDMEEAEFNPYTDQIINIELTNFLRNKNRRSDDDCDEDDHLPAIGVACKKPATLSMKLKDSILTDCNDRIGSIVSGHQFQFDGPVPQHGAIYAAGWSITKDGRLALGDCTKFYQCSSGEFYNLYDASIDIQCTPVVLNIVELKEC